MAERKRQSGRNDKSRRQWKTGNRQQIDRETVMAPFDEHLPAERRRETAIALSGLVTQIATYVICHAIVDCQELLQQERFSIAHAFLQRVTTTHMCNHKLTVEGLVYEFRGQQFQLHEAYKTMALTRSVYEHLAVFYFLYEHPATDGAREAVWQYWQENSKTQSGCMEAVANAESGAYEVRRIPYGQAWRYLFHNSDMALLYRHLSTHCHPVSDGLVQYQSQSDSDDGNDVVSLHLSSCFLAYLCRLFLKLLPHGGELVGQEFTGQEYALFRALSRLLKE